MLSSLIRRSSPYLRVNHSTFCTSTVAATNVNRTNGVDSAIAAASLLDPTQLNRMQTSNPELFHQSIATRLRDPSKRACSKVRKLGWIPSVFQGCGKYPDFVVQVHPKQFDKDYKSKYFAYERRIKWMLTGPLYELRIERGGMSEYDEELDISHMPFERVRVHAHTIAIHPMTNMPVGMQLKYAPEDEPVRIRIPIRTINEQNSPGVQNGGYLEEFIREIDVRVDPFTKPPLFATVDVGHLDMKQRVTLADVMFEGRDQGVHLILPDSTVYAMIAKV